VIKVLRHATSLDVNNRYGLATLADMDEGVNSSCCLAAAAYCGVL